MMQLQTQVFFLQCSEDLQKLPGAIAKQGATISIGLQDKNTKLHAVFARFTHCCNASNNNKEPIRESDLEFVHNEILSGNETAENSALMKNDVIKVRRFKPKEKEMAAKKTEMMHQFDLNYYRQLRTLMSGGSFDVILECGGKLKTNKGKGTILAHSAIIAKRCTWLREKICIAKLDRKSDPGTKIHCDFSLVGMSKSSSKRRKVLNLEDDIGRQSKIKLDLHVDVSPHNTKRMKIEKDQDALNLQISDAIINDSSDQMVAEDDSDESVQPFPLVGRQIEMNVACGAAKVVAEEDDLPRQGQEYLQVTRSSSPAIVPSNTNYINIKIPLENYPIMAVNLLLEYIYTNRCIPLGQDALKKLSKGYVIDPYPMKWPEHGQPTITMAVALSAISLAEEAGLPRFSHMCEIAAVHLLNTSNVMDALSLCTLQLSLSGNPLSTLRKAATLYVLQKPRLSELTSFSSLRQTFEKKHRLVIPSVLMGAQEAIGQTSKKSQDRYWMFKKHDEEDRLVRDRERRGIRA